MKTSINVVIAAVLFTLCFSCKKDNLSPYPSLSTSSADNAAAQYSTHYIGEVYGGGIVYYIDNTGRHGLIAAKKDCTEEPALWSNGNIFIKTGATKTAIGTGAKNTILIIHHQGRPGTYAALLCARFRAGGYIDWYLPSKDELHELYLQRAVVGGFKDDIYWSSTEDMSAANLAWYETFSDGYVSAFANKNIPMRVRAIRSF